MWQGTESDYKKHRIRGSITVFMSLMLMVAASLLFTLLEGSRYMILGMISIINSQSVTESMFAEYNVPAYENYHLFMMDSSYGTGDLMLSKINARMQELGQENLNPTVSGFGTYSNFLQMNVTDSSVVRYELATDYHGYPLLGQMAQVMKTELAADLLQQTYKKITGIQELEHNSEKPDDYLDGALDTLEQAKEETLRQSDQNIKQQSVSGNSPDQDIRTVRQLTVRMNADQGNIEQTDTGRTGIPGTNSAEPVDHPMEDVQKARSSPLLSQILSDGDKISVRQMAEADSAEQRTLNSGNYENSGNHGALDKILITQYLNKYTSSYRKKTGMPHVLAYEQEYILFGKYSDEENLKKMARRLLLIREGINFAYLLSDSVRREEALTMATTVTLFAGIPAAAKAVQMGILASWAYAESIVELRTLFSGGKIALLKTSDYWNVSLAETASVLFRSSVKAREVNSGITYQDYIQAFLMIESIETIGIRFSNLLEKNLRLYKGYEKIRVDCMMTAIETDTSYHARQMFLNFVTITRLSQKGYVYKQLHSFHYLKQKDDG